MAARAPKQWCLTKSETINSFENWKQNLKYILALDPHFAPFLAEGGTWNKKSRDVANRGFTSDAADQENSRTALQKATMLELMLGQVANYCPAISRHAIIKKSTSMDSIWQLIRSHFGFQSTGGHFLDFADIMHEPGERPEDLYQRLMAFVEDNLLATDGSIAHHGVPPTEDEELSPTVENMIVLTWLRLLHKDLPRLVKQRYGTELRSRTLASIKPEISQALDALLDEVQVASDTKILRSQTYTKSTKHPIKSSQHKRRCCPICKQAGRKETDHFLSQCTYLPAEDQKFLSRVRQIAMYEEESGDDSTHDDDAPAEPAVDHSSSCMNKTCIVTNARRVQVNESPFLIAFYKHSPVKITLDTGAETNMIRHSVASSVGAPISKSNQRAFQADGKTPLKIVGETRLTFSRGKLSFTFEALVVEDLDVDILGGVPFTSVNDIVIRTSKQIVMLTDGSQYNYGLTEARGNPCVRRNHIHILRAPATSTIWPGDYIEVNVPNEDELGNTVALEPRIDGRKDHWQGSWPCPDLIDNIAGSVRICNNTSDPIVVKKDQQFAQVCTAYSPTEDQTSVGSALKTKKSSVDISSVQVDPDSLLTPESVTQFVQLHDQYQDVFSSEYKGYNGAAGKYEAVVNMGPVQPPQRKGRLPLYNKSKLDELQQKCDELENLGVLRRPEDIGVVAEYLNPSFLVKKNNGTFRLVTAFSDVGRYSKPQPALMPNVDGTLRQIAQWQYIIASDLTSAFYQIPLSKVSMKYCGIATPYRGVRVYTRSAMGMPGSETALEELMCLVLGDLLQEGVVTKLADDLYCGGNTPEELLHNWERVLKAFAKSGLRLSASKTIIAPRTTTILGWVWSQGTLRASPHRIATLSSCDRPLTVRALRSYIGAYKILARVIPQCAGLLATLDDLVAGKSSADLVLWSDDSVHMFGQAQRALTSNKVVTLPRPEDKIWIVTDGAIQNRGIGATLYVVRSNKLLLAGFFSAKLRPRQVTWLPCEVEALGIATAVKHFSPFIIQSQHRVSVLTDSKPCVQAYEKLCRGEFSNSPRVATFLSTASRYQVTISHISGSANAPSDFSSRNAPECDSTSCQVCSFIAKTEESVVRHVSCEEFLSGNVRLPFTSRAAWVETQHECADLRRTHAHLTQGTRPSKKVTNARDVKRYLNVASIAKDSLLIVRRDQNLAPCRECIIVPRQVLDGLVMALHLKLKHPSTYQLKSVVSRYFYALDLDSAIGRVAEMCHQCSALKSVPKALTDQTSSPPPETFGISFAADVLRRERQYILVLRETLTSYTRAMIIENEKRDCLCEALITLCLDLQPLDGPYALVRTDAAPGFVSLVDEPLLRKHRLVLDIGHVKNINKNPVAERAIQELEQEILRHDPRGGPVTSFQLSVIVSQLNSRIRHSGMSAREMLCQRDQFKNTQLPVHDRTIALDQHQRRLDNHSASASSKAAGRPPRPTEHISIGDLVYLYCDRNKNAGRNRYLVVSINKPWCKLRKFVGNQLRATSYKVRLAECYKPVEPTSDRIVYDYDSSDTDVASDQINQQQTLPDESLEIPAEISTPSYPSDEEQDPPADTSVTAPESSNRPTRSHTAPGHLKDFVLY